VGKIIELRILHCSSVQFLQLCYVGYNYYIIQLRIFCVVNTCQKLRHLAADKVIALIKGGHFYWTRP